MVNIILLGREDLTNINVKNICLFLTTNQHLKIFKMQMYYIIKGNKNLIGL